MASMSATVSVIRAWVMPPPVSSMPPCVSQLKKPSSGSSLRFATVGAHEGSRSTPALRSQL